MKKSPPAFCAPRAFAAALPARAAVVPAMLALVLTGAGCNNAPPASSPPAAGASATVSADPAKSPAPMPDKIEKTDAGWRAALTPLQYFVLRQRGTERPGAGEYLDNHAPGIYVCAGCGLELFSSAAKYDSHCGWPSFSEAVSDRHIVKSRDTSHGMLRTEITCPRCGGHFGHVFDDGPVELGGLRYCINSAALRFVPLESMEAEGYGAFRDLAE
ncbi:MAG: peptide-methionine (R)-S-oxide reductase MsrB, partial [Opitutaceae bacterium]|nr:peptide-methionine (R)-S-oxide reductase MsrB [Opitutaceae bacterium]